MFDDPDFELQWPADLLADELEAVGRLSDYDDESLKKLLGEAFAGDAIIDRLQDNDFGGQNNEFATELGYARAIVSGFTDRLIEAARNGELTPYQPAAPRWRERTYKLQPPPTTLVDDPSAMGQQLRADFQSLILEMDNNGYFDKGAPRLCIEDQEHFDFGLDMAVEHQLGSHVDLSFLARENVYLTESTINERPLTRQENPPIADLDDDSFYELIEIFHDFAARPRRASQHDFCGYHYRSFAIEPGRRLYRWKVNQLLERHGLKLRLATEGELKGRLVESSDEARERLLTDARATASHQDATAVDHAIALFTRHGATYEDKRSAVIALAGILEPFRNTVLKTELNGSESDLFNIANNFHLRHNTPTQKKGYSGAFLDWLFWWYLATVEMAQRVIKQNP